MTIINSIISELSGEVVKKALVGVLATLLTGGIVSLYRSTKQQWVEINDQWREMKLVIAEVKQLRAEMNYVNGSPGDWKDRGIDPTQLPAPRNLVEQSARVSDK